MYTYTVAHFSSCITPLYRRGLRAMHQGLDTFVISRPRTRALYIKATFVVDRSFSKVPVIKIRVPRTSIVLIQLSQEDYAPIKSKLQHPPTPPGKSRAFDYFLCPGSGEFDLCLDGVGKIEPEL